MRGIAASLMGHFRHASQHDSRRNSCGPRVPRPYLKLSRTEEEIETMRTLKRALHPHYILNPGPIFTI
jgi:FAD/FMN-containing dehydrogenase